MNKVIKPLNEKIKRAIIENVRRGINSGDLRNPKDRSYECVLKISVGCSAETKEEAEKILLEEMTLFINNMLDS